MTALPNPEPSPPNAHRDPVTRFREEHAAILDEARVSAAMTDTEGWRCLYANHRRETNRARTALSTTIRSIADRIGSTTHTEDDEKEIGDAKKSALALRERCEHFDRETLDPVRGPAKRAADLILSANSAAAREEDADPLHSSGLTALMRDATASVPRIRWDDDTGRVVIEDGR